MSDSLANRIADGLDRGADAIERRFSADHDPLVGTPHQRLYRIEDLDGFHVHHDDADVRGWTVRTADGRSVGTVGTLMVDKDAETVRYLELVSDREFRGDYRDRATYLDGDEGRVFDPDHAEHVLVPIGLVRLDRAAHTVTVTGLSDEALGLAPRYRAGAHPRPRYEVATLRHYERHYDPAAAAVPTTTATTATPATAVPPATTATATPATADAAADDPVMGDALSFEAYRDFDDDNFLGLGDRVYMHRMFSRSGLYDRHDEAIRSKGL